MSVVREQRIFHAAQVTVHGLERVGKIFQLRVGFGNKSLKN